MYIRSAASISPQPSFLQLLQEPVSYKGNRLACIEPDYATIIDAKMLRRMSRIIRMGVAAAKECLTLAKVNMPDAIITGTAYGCLADTDLFLTKMVENKEELLTPTSFIQSTHNTVGAQIALMLKCHGYNNTFVHRGFSFESAILDATTSIAEGEASDVLVGAVDEITNTSHAILSRFGLYKKDSEDSLALFDKRSKGTLAGEGASFFVIAGKSSGHDYAKLNALHTFYKPDGITTVTSEIDGFLQRESMDMDSIDLVITGRNGDPSNDEVFEQLAETLFKGRRTLNYKQYCGEYPTAAAFALWMAANILQTGSAPYQNVKNILIYNHYLGIHHSLYLVSAC